MALTMQHLVVGLLPWTFLLPPGGWAGRIVGGREAKPHSRPYMAFLRIGTGDSCGGFLIQDDVVLTAAHCNCNLGNITVLLGAHNVTKERERGRQEIVVHRRIPHPRYNDATFENDIMLLRLAKPVKLNKFVKTIALPEPNESVGHGKVCSVAGWGRTTPEDNTSVAKTLREVDVEVLKDARCKSRNYNALTMLCAGQPCSCRNSAKGDSGGPLVCGGKAQGIVSHGSYNPPAVYTRVSAFTRWIRSVIGRPHP